MYIIVSVQYMYCADTDAYFLFILFSSASGLLIFSCPDLFHSFVHLLMPCLQLCVDIAMLEPSSMRGEANELPDGET